MPILSAWSPDRQPFNKFRDLKYQIPGQTRRQGTGRGTDGLDRLVECSNRFGRTADRLLGLRLHAQHRAFNDFVLASIRRLVSEISRHIAPSILHALARHSSARLFRIAAAVSLFQPSSLSEIAHGRIGECCQTSLGRQRQWGLAQGFLSVRQRRRPWHGSGKPNSSAFHTASIAGVISV